MRTPIERGLDNADPEWRTWAQRGVITLAQTQSTLTAEEVGRWVEERGHRTHDRRALGGVMLWAAARRYIRRTEVESRAARGGKVRVWRSLIHYGTD